MSLFIKNLLNPSAIKANKLAFVQLPGDGAISFKPTSKNLEKITSTENILSDSLATRDGLYQPKAAVKPSKKQQAAKRKDIVAAFGEMASPDAINAKKTKQPSSESILEDSLKTRDGYTAVNVSKTVLLGAKKLYNGLKSVFAAAVGSLLALAGKAISLVKKPFVTLKNNGLNKAAFAELPSTESINEKLSAMTPEDEKATAFKSLPNLTA